MNTNYHLMIRASPQDKLSVVVIQIDKPRTAHIAPHLSIGVWFGSAPLEMDSDRPYMLCPAPCLLCIGIEYLRMRANQHTELPSNCLAQHYSVSDRWEEIEHTCNLTMTNYVGNDTQSCYVVAIKHKRLIFGNETENFVKGEIQG